MTIDNTGKINDGNIYVTWNSSWNIHDSVLFSRSVNKGGSYSSSPIMLDHYDANHVPHMPRIAVGANGEVFSAWYYHTNNTHTGEMRIAKSTNGGASFGPFAHYSINSIDGDIKINSTISIFSYPALVVDPKRGKYPNSN